MSTNEYGNEDNTRVEKYNILKTMLCKRFVAGLKLANIFQLSKVKAQEHGSGTDTDSSVSVVSGIDRDCDTIQRVNKYNSSIISDPTPSSINNEEVKERPSKTYIINGVDISQFISENEVQEYLKNETGRDRLHEMFSKNDLNQYSPQLWFIATVEGEVAMMSWVYFSYRSFHGAAEEFKRNNRGTLFGSRFLAKRRFNDHMLLDSIKRGVFWSVKLTSFTAMYLLLSQSISTYRNKTSPLEHGIAGAITGAFFRFNMGPKGMFAGAVISGPVGLLFGTLVCGLFYLFNSTQEQMHYCNIQAKLYEKKENQGIVAPLPPSPTTKIQTGYGGES